MKKFLLICAVMLFTMLSANASTTVYFQNTGVPVAIQHGAGPKVSIHSIRSNPNYRPMAYHNHAHPYNASRYARNHYARPRGMRPMNNNNIVIGDVPPRPVAVNTAPVSRFDRSYQPSVSRSYSRNGMIYYN